MEELSLRKRLVFSIFFNLSIVAAEVIGGIFSRSVALLSDALHNSGDVTSMIVGYFGVKVSERGEDSRFTYGYERAKIVSALVNSVFILTLGVLIFFEGVKKIVHPVIIDEKVLFPVALVGLFGNIFTILMLKGHHHEDLNIKSVMIHIIGDTLSSILIVAFAILLYFKKWYFLDGVISTVVATYLIVMSVKVFKRSSYIIMQGVPEGWSIEKVKALVEHVKGAKEAHHIHIWSPDGKKVHVELHVKKDVMYENDEIVKNVREQLIKNGIDHVTVQVEENECPDKGGEH